MRKFYAFLLVFIFSIVYRASAQTPISGFYVTNNTVRTVVQDGNTVYIGGDFTYVAPNNPYGASLNTTTGVPDLSYPKPNAQVNVAVPDGSGGWFIGGNFTKLGSQARNYIARINADGTLHPWNPNASGAVNTIAVNGSTVYVGGSFNNIGGQARNSIAALNATTGLATAWNPNSNNLVYTIAVSGSTVYAGGFFTTIGGQPRDRIAALDATTGIPTAWNPGADGQINTIAVNGSTVYAGGGFTTIG